MTLAFSQKINDKPTYFVEKIWQSLPCKMAIDGNFFNGGKMYKNYPFSKNAYDMQPKLHTIRKDFKKRWKEGNDIHFSINVRTKKQFQFAPVVKCVSVQAIEICKHPNHNVFSVYVDGQYLNPEDTAQLALNDGFDSEEDFFEYFNEDFTGKIIHWTNLKY